MIVKTYSTIKQKKKEHKKHLWMEFHEPHANEHKENEKDVL